MQQLLYQAVVAALLPRAEAVAARPSDLMEALESQADEELRGAAPWRTVGKSSQNVVIIDAKTIQRRHPVPVP